jgi:hypothetical protein
LYQTGARLSPLPFGFVRQPPEKPGGQLLARAQLQLLLRKGVLPRTLDVLAALGDIDGLRDCLESTRPGGDVATVTHAFLCACGFQHKAVAALLLSRCIELDPELGERVEKWRGRSGFIDYLAEHPVYGSPWRTVVMNELQAAMHGNDLEEFNRWLQREPDLLGESNLGLQVGLTENAAYNDRGPFIARLIELSPALRVKRPPSSALDFALEYGNAHLIPLLTQIWPLPDDLPHAAGVGDFARVRGWFDEAGRPGLRSPIRKSQKRWAKCLCMADHMRDGSVPPSTSPLYSRQERNRRRLLDSSHTLQSQDT